ncbi:MAG TPA: cache domain-containing protein, partial [Kofleriaceae bacterium]|nr:cache domain-containing protein [Kofleriaceae bacterium]
MGARRLFSYPISLAVVVAALIAATGGWIAWWNYRAGLANIRDLAGSLFDQVARQTASSTEAYVRRAPPAAESLATIVALDRPQTSSDMMARRCIAVLRANAGFAWVSYADTRGTFTGAFRAGDKIRVNRSVIEGGTTRFVEHELGADDVLVPFREGQSTYDPRTRPYWKLVAKAKRAAWTPPYVFAENVPGITYAVPMFDEGQLEGVFTIDFDLGRLSELARTLQFSPNGRVVIVSDEEIVLAHPTVSLIANVDGRVDLVGTHDVPDRALAAVLA